MSSTWTKTQIATRALEIIGADDAAIIARAELWLDAILRAMALQWRMPELAKQHTAAVGDGTATVSYPSDYGFLIADITSGAVGTFTQSGGSASKVYPASLGMTRDVPGHAEGSGTPQAVADDPGNARWILHPISNQPGTIALNYQRVPASVAPAVVVWYPNELLLMNEIVAIGERYMRGDRLTVDIQVKEAAKRLALQAPSRGQLFSLGGAGSNLDRRTFR